MLGHVLSSSPSWLLLVAVGLGCFWHELDTGMFCVSAVWITYEQAI